MPSSKLKTFAILSTLLLFVDVAFAQFVQTRIVSASPTVSTTPAYTAGDAVGGLMTFSNACLSRTGKGEIRGVTVLDKAAQGQDLDLIVFSRNPTSAGGGTTTVTDNAAFDPADTDLSRIAKIIPVTTHKALADNGVSQAANVSYSIACDKTVVSTTGQLPFYGVLVARNAGTLQYAATTDITVQVEMIAD